MSKSERRQSSHRRAVSGMAKRKHQARVVTCLLTLLVAGAAVALPGGASACACGELQGIVVAHGTSPNGLPWRIKESRIIGVNPEAPRTPYLISEFLIDDVGDGGGYGFAMPFSLFQKFIFHAGARIDESPESDLSGVTTWRAVKLEVEMSDGQVLTVEPSLPPSSLRQRFHWLRGLRFFDVFFSASQRAVMVTAFDRDGRVLGRSKSRHGSFLAWREE